MLISSSTLFQEFQNYQAYIEMHSLIFETDKTTISHPVPRVLLLLYKRILTLFQGFHFSSTRGYSPCSKGSNSPLQEDTHPVPRVLTLLHKRIISTLMSLLSEPGESRNLLFQF
jgi:hypothetical protein